MISFPQVFLLPHQKFSLVSVLEMKKNYRKKDVGREKVFATLMMLDDASVYVV